MKAPRQPTLFLLATMCDCFLLFARPADAFLVSPSSSSLPPTTGGYDHHVSSIRTTAAHVSSRKASFHIATPLANSKEIRLSRHRCSQATAKMLLESGSGGGGDGGGSGDMFSMWKKVTAATAVGLTIFGGGVLMPVPEYGAAGAAMAPSLMQDERGYISIFEKVSTVGSSIKGALSCLCDIPSVLHRS